MKYIFALLMVLALALTPVSAEQAAAQALGNGVERAQDRQQIRQNSEATLDDLADLDALEMLHQEYSAAVEKGDLSTIPTLDHRFMNLLGEEQRESGQELRQSRAEVRQDKRELRSDRREKSRNRKAGASWKARADDARDTRDDRRDLGDDVGDLKVARQEEMNLATVRSSFGALVGNTEAKALQRKLKLMGVALELGRREVAGNAAESREDRQELREDRRESREDRRQR